MNSSRVKQHSYLIIGGTTKAATTSLFYYLADHPEVCTSNLKEIRFFLDKDYPEASNYRYEDGLEKYDDIFRYAQCSHVEKIRMEATPDYLYSLGTPHKIKQSLPNVKLIFILREPVSRLISWYKFAKQKEYLPQDISFDNYVDKQLINDNFEHENTYTYMRSLEQGRYSVYLKPYFELFGSDRIYVNFYEELSRNPKSVLEKICRFAGIDPSFYGDYLFKVYNPSKAVKNWWFHRNYEQFLKSMRQYTQDKPIHKVLRKIRRSLDPIYLRLNVQPQEKVSISPAIKNALTKYYKQEVIALEKLLGRSVPWESWN
ncbi:MAG: sulfotransferase domain-containing protein [Moorea sp. SIO3G5]|nr:sulfotransferase domain-containing protein [Moorena sp. SIO3G5]